MQSDIAVFAPPGKNKRYLVSEEAIIKERVPPFFRIGGNMSYNRSGYPIYKDLGKTMEQASKGVHWFFWKLLNERNPHTNIAVIKAKDETELKKITRAYKEIKKLNIAIRTKQQHYLINPAVAYPDYGYYANVYDNWYEHTKEAK